MTDSNTKRIAELNDLCRTAPGLGGRWMETIGFRSLPQDVQSEIREKVEIFNDFNPDNDPYRERNFGSIRHAGVHVFWKIDYYDREMKYGSEDPADPKQTTRVLTVMLAEEY
jgi:hypothetical protein